MIAARFVYNGKLRVGVLTENKVSRKGKQYMKVYHGAGRYKNYRWEKALNVELFKLDSLTAQLLTQ